MTATLAAPTRPRLAVPAIRWWALLRFLVCALVVVMMLAPLAIVIIISFSSAPFLSFPPPGFSLQWYEKFFGSAAWLDALATTVKVMIPVSLLATALGTMAALGIARGRAPFATALGGLLMAPLVVPVIITAAAIFGAFRAWGLHGTLLGLILAHTVLTLPFVLSTVLASLRMVDRSLENAALTLGATPWHVFWRITFPLILPGVVSGLLFALVMSFDELVVSLFISTPSLRPITVEMWSDVRGAVDPTITAISTSLFLFSLLLLLTESLARRRLRARRPDSPEMVF
ncbi:MAG TPA: ABC transporter permease [Alphaproteobacteria bacterium]|nr:ABC transporter permease [Alphaproteobacteria bacterium]